jgi:alpha-glucosidase (family GH31 glycosyl hydrolase)
MRHYYRLRTRLVPYIATQARIAYDTGVQVSSCFLSMMQFLASAIQIVRPMYYSYPKIEHAYADQVCRFMAGYRLW